MEFKRGMQAGGLDWKVKLSTNVIFENSLQAGPESFALACEMPQTAWFRPAGGCPFCDAREDGNPNWKTGWAHKRRPSETFYSRGHQFTFSVHLIDAYSRKTNLRVCAHLTKTLGLFYFSLDMQSVCTFYNIRRLDGYNPKPTTTRNIDIYSVDFCGGKNPFGTSRFHSHGMRAFDLNPLGHGLPDASFFFYQLDRSPEQMVCP